MKKGLFGQNSFKTKKYRGKSIFSGSGVKKNKHGFMSRKITSGPLKGQNVLWF